MPDPGRTRGCSTMLDSPGVPLSQQELVTFQDLVLGSTDRLECVLQVLDVDE